MQFCVTRVILRDLAALVPQIFHSLHKITHFLTGYINSYFVRILCEKKPQIDLASLNEVWSVVQLRPVRRPGGAGV
jgi:hypothetical protein